jgi:tetraprenyl-beta-curcumene synthase
MSTATHTENGRVERVSLDEAPDLASPPPLLISQDLQFVRVFGETVLIYLLRVLPQVRTELAHWRVAAAEIPDLTLRRAAAQALQKRGNIEGAALFATMAPSQHRRNTVRALVALQTAYNYLDALSERPSEDPIANADQLHQALLIALRPGTEHVDYYAHNKERSDGGYLTAILDNCQTALAGLPSYPALAPTARFAAARILDFQALNQPKAHGGHEALKRWATEAAPAGTAPSWWETAAAAGSSLSVHALIAAAADPHLDPDAARDIDRAYFPWTGALHSLLDSLVDRDEDHRNGQPSLIGYYKSPTDAALRLQTLALRGRAASEPLPCPQAHRVILTAMCAYYLSAPECHTAESQTIARTLTRALGPSLNIAIAMFRARRLVSALTDPTYT